MHSLLTPKDGPGRWPDESEGRPSPQPPVWAHCWTQSCGLCHLSPASGASHSSPLVLVHPGTLEETPPSHPPMHLVSPLPPLVKVTAADFGGTQRTCPGRKGLRGPDSPKPQAPGVFPCQANWPNTPGPAQDILFRPDLCKPPLVHISHKHLLSIYYAKRGFQPSREDRRCGEGSTVCFTPGGWTRRVRGHPAFCFPGRTPCHAGSLRGGDRLCAPSRTLKSNAGRNGERRVRRAEGNGS